MATIRKRKKSKTKRISFKPGTPKRRIKQKANWFGPSLISILKILAVICFFCGVVIGLAFLEKYVKETITPSEGKVDLELVDVPAWVDDQLKKKVYAAA